MTIAENYGLKLTKGYDSKHGQDQTVVLPEQLVGVELEIEGFPDSVEHSFGGMIFTSDGSLRSDGRGMGIEAITKPIQVRFLPAFLRSFFDKFAIGENNYSERCSTHVHFNVQPLEWETVVTVCLLYQTVERLLFRYIGHDRADGIFCVPWYQSNMSFNIAQKMMSNGDGVRRKWQKYSALNLLPMADKGTIEFRHLHGTCDVAKIMEWINIVSRLFYYAQQTPLEGVKASILNMNTISNYRAWLTEVFGRYVDVLQADGYEAELATGVIDSKLMLMGQPAMPVLESAYTAIMARINAEAPRWEPLPEQDEEDGQVYNIPFRPAPTAQTLGGQINIGIGTYNMTWDTAGNLRATPQPPAGAPPPPVVPRGIVEERAARPVRPFVRGGGLR